MEWKGSKVDGKEKETKVEWTREGVGKKIAQWKRKGNEKQKGEREEMVIKKKGEANEI